MGLFQPDKILHSKGNYKKKKRQLMEWEKIVSNDAIDKGLIAKIYEQLDTTQQQEKPTTQWENGQET